MDMFLIAAAQFLFKLACAITAIWVMNWTLRLLNKRTGNRFDATLTDATPNVRLGYFGARLIAYAYIVGSIIS